MEALIVFIVFSITFGVFYLFISARNKERLALIEKGASIRAHDPQGIEEARALLPQNITYSDNAYEACKNADAVILMTEWNQYRALDLSRLGESMKQKIFIDLRNVYNPELLKEHGFRYVGVGRS